MYKWFKWCISDLRSVSARVNARGYPCAKRCNSSTSQWLSGKQVRLWLGHPKVHFGTIVEGSWGGGGGGGMHGRSSGLSHYLFVVDFHLLCMFWSRNGFQCMSKTVGWEWGECVEQVQWNHANVDRICRCTHFSAHQSQRNVQKCLKPEYSWLLVGCI